MSTNSAYSAYCIAFATTGCVFGRNCSLRHDIYQCQCGTILRQIDQESHYLGKRHQLLLSTPTDLEDKVQDQHELCFRGQKNNQSTSIQDMRQPFINNEIRHVLSDETYDNWTLDHSERPLIGCEICHKKTSHSNYHSHMEWHIGRQRIDTILEDAAEDKEGVKVTGRSGINFGVLDILHPVEVPVSITSTESTVSLQKYQMRSSSRHGEDELKFSVRLRGKSRTIQQGCSRVLSIIFHPSYAGIHEDTLELVFYDIIRKRSFIITRTVSATVGSKDDYDQLQAKAPYTRKKTTKFQSPRGTIHILRPQTYTKVPWVEKLSSHAPPKSLIEATYGPNANPKLALENVKGWMPSALNGKSYAWWFQVLLFLEEEQMRLDLKAYSLSDVELEWAHPYYNLLVEGLAENRPSILIGDIILVTHSNSLEVPNNRSCYEGRVVQVHQKHVSLRFGDIFDHYQGTKFDVQFTLNRLPFRRMHHVLVNNYNPAHLLFPESSHIEGVTRVTREMMNSFIPFYKPLKQDEEQLKAVTAIINQKPGSVPFILFGPPGTGKTITLVEAMRQILYRDSNARILACAPNNAAADLIAQKMMHRGTSQVFRLNSVSRRVDDLPHCLRDFSLVNSNQEFDIPNLEQLAKYRVVVATCLSAGIPANLGVKRGHYSHIVIDEAGQGKEPEIIVPIKGIAGPNTNVIIAGDNQQLGPVVHSQLAKSLGLHTSYLARMMSRSIYDLKTNQGITIVKLVKNFRSHRDILQFSNDNFYESELQPCADRTLVHSLDAYKSLPTKRFPLIFHGVIGHDEREASSPSFFNIDEATLVKDYCLDLLDSYSNTIKPDDIGVITSYHAQRCKIADLLSKNSKLRYVKVGSVEEFQGQERLVIIISTVRSNKEFITSDIKRSLGFVANKNRLNVALTRAQALLIVIGNPIVLSLDPLWRRFLNFIHKRGGWTGKEIDWDPKDTVLDEATDRYSAEKRAREEGDLKAAMVRLRALILETHASDGFELFEGESEDDATFGTPILCEAE